MYSFKYILLIVSLLNTGVSCAQKKRIPVMASHTILAGHNTYENYRNIEDAGFTLAKEWYPSVSIAIDHLKMASRTNVKLIIWCPELFKDVDNTIKQLTEYDSFGGYDLSDEPSTKAFDSLGTLIRNIKKKDKSHYIWQNLYPIHASLEYMNANSYEDYVDEYIKIVDPPFVSFDFYGITKSGVHPEYYHNLELISKKCKNTHKPFWAYVLASQFKDYAEPTKGTLSFQVYNNLAYGAQGIEYFSYRQIVQQDLHITVSPVDTNYQKMPIYYEVRKLNSEIKYYSSYFYGNNVKEVTHLSNEIPIGTNATRHLPYGIKVRSYSGDGFVVSYFTCRKSEYLLFVNKDYKQPQSIEIESPHTLRRISYYSSERKRGKGVIHFDTQPGSIVLLKIK